MPAALPAGYIPKADAQHTTNYRVRSVRFGDGYEQNSPDGLNAIQEEYSLTFPALSKAAGDTLEAFFDARGGWDAVLWTPPNGVTALRWLVSQVRRTYVAGTLMSDISCTFRRTYG